MKYPPSRPIHPEIPRHPPGLLYTVRVDLGVLSYLPPPAQAHAHPAHAQAHAHPPPPPPCPPVETGGGLVWPVIEVAKSETLVTRPSDMLPMEVVTEFAKSETDMDGPEPPAGVVGDPWKTHQRGRGT